MPVPDNRLPSSPRRASALNPLKWRLPRIETYPVLIAFAQTLIGKLVLFAVFGLLMKLISQGMWIADRHMWLLITIAAALVSLAGRYRHLALLIATGILLAHAPYWFDYSAVQEAIRQEQLSDVIRFWELRAGTFIACVPLVALALYLTRYYRDHPLGRRPLLLQHLLYFFLLGLATSRLLQGFPQVVLWSLTATYAAYFWYLAYALMNQRQRTPQSMLFHFATFQPFFSSTVVPVGKGAANWHSVEAGGAEELAVTQLKAVKLLFWALLLKEGVLWLLRWGVYQELGVPPLKIAFDQFLRTGYVPVPLGLFSVIFNFPDRLLVVAIGGHVIVATARLAGFRLLRNTWRPLSARTIAEFWNRYVYYFKEILVHVYFYPTYVRYFKQHPRLRLAFATLMAAGVGNFIFHFMENYTVVKFGLLDSLERAQTYAFYCAVLVTGIVISQLRTRKPDPNAGWLRRQFFPSLGVAVFFCFLSFFDGPQQHVGLAQHFEFLSKMFSIDRWLKMI